ncbi:MAG: hypothetical protein ACK500_08580 [Flavobacteriales bacterium]|jgi:hypothetical protein
MASHSGKKESVFFLWIIVPVAVLLTLLLVRVNHNATPPKEVLDGDRPALTESAPAASVPAVADTTSAAADTTAAAAPAPAAH